MNIEHLSERELLVWKYVVEGLSIQQMADKLGIRFEAAHARIYRLCYKLGLPHDPNVSRRTQLIRAAERFYNE